MKYLTYESKDPSITSARALQVGILSTGSECTEVGLHKQVVINGETVSEPAFKPSKYFKVSKVRDWIKATIEAETGNSSPLSVYAAQDDGNIIPINPNP